MLEIESIIAKMNETTTAKRLKIASRNVAATSRCHQRLHSQMHSSQRDHTCRKTFQSVISVDSNVEKI